jgi:hypothetical protein
MNKRLLIAGSFFLMSMTLTMGVLGGEKKPTTITPTPNPYPTASAPRQGVVANSYPPSEPYLPQLGSWAWQGWKNTGPFPTDVQWVPMLVRDTVLPTLAEVQAMDAQTDHGYWLVFNECENWGVCNTPPEEQAELYHDEVLPLVYDQGGDPDAELIIGGSSAHPCGLAWLTRFVETYRSLYGEDPPRAGWHFHVYPEVGPRPDLWQPGEPCPDTWPGAVTGEANITNYVEDAERFRRWWSLYGSPDDEVWLTETGCLAMWFQTHCPDTTVHPNMVDYMAAITAYLNDQGRWIDRYSWYVDYDDVFESSWLITDPTISPVEFTDIGIYYSQVVPSAHVPGYLYPVFLPLVLKDYSSGDQQQIQPAPLPYPPPSIQDAPPLWLPYPPPYESSQP